MRSLLLYLIFSVVSSQVIAQEYSILLTGPTSVTSSSTAKYQYTALFIDENGQPQRFPTGGTFDWQISSGQKVLQTPSTLHVKWDGAVGENWISYTYTLSDGNGYAGYTSVFVEVPIPPAPTNLGATNITASSFRAQWQNVTEAVNGYRVYVKVDYGSGWINYNSYSTTSATNTLDITNLSYGRYAYQVEAINQYNNSSPRSSESTLTLIPPTPSLNYISVQINSFVLTWNQFSFVTSYDLQVANDPGFSQNLRTFSVQGGNSTIDALNPSTTYYCRIRSNNSQASSPYTGPLSVTTSTPPPMNYQLNLYAASSDPVTWSQSVEYSYILRFIDEQGVVVRFPPGGSFQWTISSGQKLTETTTSLKIRWNGSVGNNHVNYVFTDQYGHQYPASLQVYVNPPKPPSPISLGAINITSSSFRAQWQAVAEASHGYSIAVESNFGGGWVNFGSFNVGTSVTHLDLNSLAYGNYSYRVLAINEYNISSSPSSPQTLSLLPPVPNASTSAAGETQFTLSWSTFPFVTSYEIEVAENAAFTQGLRTLSINAGSTIILGLNPNTVYYCKVRSVNSQGKSSFSQTVSSTTLVPPARDYQLVLTPASQDVVVWSNSLTYQYNLQFFENGQSVNFPGEGTFQWAISSGQKILETNKMLQLKWNGAVGDNQVTYTYWDAYGRGYAANINVFVESPIPPVPTGLLAQEIGTSSFKASWTSVPEALNGYKVLIRYDGGSGSAVLQESVVALNNITLTGLSYGKYTFSVRSINQFDVVSPESQSYHVLLIPPAPNNVQSTLITDEAARISWNEIPFATEYHVLLTDGTGLNQMRTTGNLFQDFSDLIGDGQYSVQVRSSNLTGSSSFSPIKNFLTLPAAPELLASSDITLNSFTANWKSQPGINSYLVDVSTDAEFTIIIYQNLSSTTNSLLIPALSPKLSYFYRVRSVNATGASRYSLASSGSRLLEYNYLRTITLQHKTTESLIQAKSSDSILESTLFMDGLGKEMQNVDKKISPTGMDLVQPFLFDEHGRNSVVPLPISIGSDGEFKPNVFDEQARKYLGAAATFYTDNGTIAKDSQPYAVNIFEASPLGRVIKQGSPGLSWQPNSSITDFSDKTIKRQYSTNVDQEVLKFDFDPASGLISISPATKHYSANQLYINKTYDEHNNDVSEFVDKEGRTICKKVKVNAAEYASTYYIYDDFGNLVVVLPPEAVAKFSQQ